MAAKSAAPAVWQQVHFVLVCVGLVAAGNLGDVWGLQASLCMYGSGYVFRMRCMICSCIGHLVLGLAPSFEEASGNEFHIVLSFSGHCMRKQWYECSVSLDASCWPPGGREPDVYWVVSVRGIVWPPPMCRCFCCMTLRQKVCIGL